MPTPTTLFDLDLDEHQLLRIEVENTSIRQAQEKPGKALTTASEQVANVPFHTNGWDTVYAIRLTDVNRAIAAKGTSPTNWSATIPKSRWSPQVDATGSFNT